MPVRLVVVESREAKRNQEPHKTTLAQNLEEDLLAAKKFWLDEANIEITWASIEYSANGDERVLENGDEVDRVVNKYYNGQPVFVFVDQIEEVTSGMTARSRNGFAVEHTCSPGTIAHELCHVLAPYWRTHTRDPYDILCVGDRRRPFPEIHLTSQQIENSRAYVLERGWASQ